jgi:hypothetical protein
MTPTSLTGELVHGPASKAVAVTGADPRPDPLQKGQKRSWSAAQATSAL